VLHLRDPHDSGSYGFCPFYAATGHYCPGCGGLRAVNDLTNGDLASAASSNLLFVASIPVLVYAWFRWLRVQWRGDPAPPLNPYVLTSVSIGLMVVFTVVRNLPFGAWLEP